MKKRLGITIAITAVSGGLILFAQAPRSGEVQFKAAQSLEQVEGDLTGAIEAYQQLVDGSDRELAARALVAIGECYEKLGAAESRSAYERVIQEFADQADPVTTARTRLAALDSEAEDGRIVVRKLVEGWFWPMWPSHDGRFVPFERGNDLFVRDLDTDTERLVVSGPTTGNRELERAVISHDNSKLAYTISEVDYGVDEPRPRYELRVIDVNGTGDRLAFEDRSSYRRLRLADWSPTSDTILAATWGWDDVCQLLLVNASTGSRTVRYRLPECNSIDGLFSPDGRHIVFSPRRGSGQTQDILSIPIQSGDPTPIVAHPATDDLEGWTSDGRLVFLSDRSSTWDLWTVPVQDGRAAGEPELLKRDILKQGPGEAPFGFTRRGSYFYLSQSNVEDVETATLDVSSGRLDSSPVPVSRRFEGANHTPDYSRDGRFLAYVSGPQGSVSVRIRNLETSEERSFPIPGTRDVTWFPDGRSLLLWCAAPQESSKLVFYKVDAETGEGSVLFSDKVSTDHAINPTFDPKGEWLYFITYPDPQNTRGLKQVARYHLQSGKLEIVAESPSPTERYNEFALSPDGEQLVLKIQGEGPSRLATMPVGGGQPRVVYTYSENEPTRNWGALEFTADGSAILHQRMGDGNFEDQLLLTPLDGGPTKVLADTHMIFRIAVHPDGRRLAWWTGHTSRELWVMENLASAQTASQ